MLLSIPKLNISLKTFDEFIMIVMVMYKFTIYETINVFTIYCNTYMEHLRYYANRFLHFFIVFVEVME